MLLYVVLHIFLILSILQWRLIYSNVFNPVDYQYVVHRLERCNEAAFFPIAINFTDFKIKKQNGISIKLMGKIEVLKPVEIDFRLTVHGLYCTGPEDRTCMHSFIKKFGYICQKFQEADQPWYAFVHHKFECPISPGNYSLRTAVIDINALSCLPLSEGYWIIKVYGYSGSDVVMCLYSEMELIELTSFPN